MINKSFFLERASARLFGGKMKKSQAAGLDSILEFWIRRHAEWDDRWLAYALGTTHLETGAAMAPIDEYGGPKYFEGNYGPGGHDPARARKMGNMNPGDGARYHGRGYVQLTWKVNYQKMSTHLSAFYGRAIDLVASPDDAKRPDYAVEIMFHGMYVGTFTTRKFSDYFTKTAAGQPAKDNWAGARAIINGTDKKDVIANLAKDYYACISYV